jgi:TPP-dependent pyruvate/acetoin dehydrogenase alpha subunit
MELVALRPPCEDLLRIHRDMAIIRAFETMLNDVKLKGNYQGIEYNHRGPAHLSIGQEASAVGQAFLLGADDHISAATAVTAKFWRRASLLSRNWTTIRSSP